jgi:hypothetical protein
MNRARIAAFERVDEDDQMLAVDGLDEFLPTQSDIEDPTLTVNTLYKLFGDKPFVAPQPPPSEEPRGTMFDPTSDAGSLEAFFRRLEQTVPAAHPAVAVDEAVYEAVESFEVDEDTLEEVAAPRELRGSAVVSATQQVALDFQRFAEKFHAFAAECQQR